MKIGFDTSKSVGSIVREKNKIEEGSIVIISKARGQNLKKKFILKFLNLLWELSHKCLCLFQS